MDKCLFEGLRRMRAGDQHLRIDDAQRLHELLLMGRVELGRKVIDADDRPLAPLRRIDPRLCQDASERAELFLTS